MGPIDIAVFLIFVATVVTVGISMSRHEGDSESYFLAGRGLKWWLIGFSLIAANISTEQFVGMSGNAASHVGLAIASYEWMAAITLVVVGFGFLPYFLRAGIFTMPEFLEYRYDGAARTLMAVATIFIYMLLLGSVTYSGALTLRTLAMDMGLDISLMAGSLVIGVIAMVYVATGGLKACAWADLLQGSALIVGGGMVMYFAFQKLGVATEAAVVTDVVTGAVGVRPLEAGTGAVERFVDLNGNRLNMFLPASDSVLPWTALLLGLWIPNFYYWGLNQYITQRTLGSASLAQGQKGIVFAAFLKLLIPFVVVIPGMIAFNLYAKDMRLLARADNAVPLAKYAKANPGTAMVRAADTPGAGAIEGWPGPGYLIALYPDAAAMKAETARHPLVLPMTRPDYEAIAPSAFIVFRAEDHAWRTANPELAAEIDGHNARSEAGAKAAGKKVEVEKLTAHKYDTALGLLLGRVLPQRSGALGFVMAALLGAVVSSLAAMLNAASTILTMDIYRKLVAPGASQRALVGLGRASVVGFTLVAVVVAPQLGNPKIGNSIFTIIQEGQGFISSGILSIFAFGILVRRAPRACGVAGLLTNIIAYGALKVAVPQLQFLNRMAVCFGLCLLVLTVMTWLRPLPKPVEFEKRVDLDLESSPAARKAGIGVVVLTVILYAIFSPLVVAR